LTLLLSSKECLYVLLDRINMRLVNLLKTVVFLIVPELAHEEEINLLLQKEREERAEARQQWWKDS
jgi:hypothetical protein